MLAVKEELIKEEKINFIDNNVRKEVIFNKIYMMASPSKEHQKIVFNIAKNLSEKETESCEVIISPFDVELECNGTNIVQPDVVVFCDEKVCAIFEVLSPSTAIKDKVIKKNLYECAGVKEYFLISPEYKIVEKYELKNQKYEFIGTFAESEIEVKCLNAKIDIKEFFKGIKKEDIN